MADSMTQTAKTADVVTTFEREERYIVIKRKHLSEAQEDEVRRTLAAAEINTVECVVVESDWPEYETVWKMIEARVTGSSITAAESDWIARAVEALRAARAVLQYEIASLLDSICIKDAEGKPIRDSAEDEPSGDEDAKRMETVVAHIDALLSQVREVRS